MVKRLLLLLALLAAAGVLLEAQQRAIAAKTLQTTDTTANSLLVGCAVGSTTCTGGIKAGPITGSTGTFTGAVTAATAAVTTFTSLFSNTALGTHTFGGGSLNGASRVQNINTSAGTLATADFIASAGTTSVGIQTFSEGFTASGSAVTAGTRVYGNGAGGLTLDALHASGAIKFAINQSTKWGINSAGDLTFGSAGNIVQASSTPTLSGFGTSAGVTGTGFAFRVSTGSTSSTGGNVTFGRTFANTPICVAMPESAGLSGFYISGITTTFVTFTFAASTNQTFTVHCQGY